MSSLMVKTVLEVDLVSYGEIAHALEEHLDAHAVKALELQIQSFIDRALAEAGLLRTEVVSATAGDSAILVFDTPSEMHRFAESLSGLATAHNKGKSTPSAERWFRMGASTGELSIAASPCDAVGMARTRAVRLEAAAEPGSLLIDVATFETLPSALRGRYGPEIIVAGKRGERYQARSCRLVELPAKQERVAYLLRSPLEGIWDQLDAELQDAFALAYNQKLRERLERPVRISTRDLFRALARVNDQALLRLLGTLPAGALPEPAESPVSTERNLLSEGHELSDCIAESLEAFAGAHMSAQKVAAADLFVDISKNGHGNSVSQLRAHGIGPDEIEDRVALLGMNVFVPKRMGVEN